MKVAVLILAMTLLLVGFHADKAFLQATRAAVEVIKEIKSLF